MLLFAWLDDVLAAKLTRIGMRMAHYWRTNGVTLAV
jgi:hypothetical protein